MSRRSHFEGECAETGAGLDEPLKSEGANMLCFNVRETDAMLLATATSARCCQSTALAADNACRQRLGRVSRKTTRAISHPGGKRTPKIKQLGGSD